MAPRNRYTTAHRWNGDTRELLRIETGPPGPWGDQYRIVDGGYPIALIPSNERRIHKFFQDKGYGTETANEKTAGFARVEPVSTNSFLDSVSPDDVDLRWVTNPNFEANPVGCLRSGAVFLTISAVAIPIIIMVVLFLDYIGLGSLMAGW